MAEETTSNEEVQPAEVTEDDLRNLIGEEIDKRVTGLSDGISGLADSIVEKLKGDGSNEDGLLEKIGNMIDEKMKGLGGSSKTDNGKTEANSGERIPRFRVFK